jgi:lipoate-protein ligase A
MKGEGGRGKAEGQTANCKLQIANCELADSASVWNAKPEIRDSLRLPPSPFRLLLDPPASGPWNMAVDETLLETAAADGQCTWRFYRWQEPTLSLGYFQTYADRRQHAASGDCPAVRRTTGGGAILHDAELTYSVAIPCRHPLAMDRLGLYRAVHTALIEALADWGIAAAMFEGGRRKGEDGGGKAEGGNRELGTCSLPSASPLPPSPLSSQPFLCFQRRSPGDVLMGETKIAGSAQRRCRGAVLQHGSVLLARSAAAPELDGLTDLVDNTIGPEQLAQAWVARLADAWFGTWHGGRLSGAQRRRAAVLAAGKYASCAWTEDRYRG